MFINSVSWTWPGFFKGTLIGWSYIGCNQKDQSFHQQPVLYVLVAQLCPTLWDPKDCSPPGFSVHGILQARLLEWIAIPFSRGSSWPRNWTLVSCIAGRFFTTWATGNSNCPTCIRPTASTNSMQQILDFNRLYFPPSDTQESVKSEGISHSVMFDSLWPHGLWPTRLLCPWNSPDKNTGMGSG